MKISLKYLYLFKYTLGYYLDKNMGQNVLFCFVIFLDLALFTSVGRHLPSRRIELSNCTY